MLAPNGLCHAIVFFRRQFSGNPFINRYDELAEYGRYTIRLCVVIDPYFDNFDLSGIRRKNLNFGRVTCFF